MSGETNGREGVGVVPLDEAVEMVLDGRITDALAMASLMKVQLLRDRGTLPA